MKRPLIHRISFHETVLFLLLLLCYAYVFPRWADPNQNSRLDMVVAVVEDGTFQIDKYVENTVDYAKVGDHYYSDKAPGAAFLGIPIYAALKLVFDSPVIDRLMDRLAANEAFQATLRADGSGILKQKVRFALAQVVLSFATAALPSALLGVLMFRLLQLFSPLPLPRLLVVLGYGLLTPAFAYAGAFYGHQLSAALLFGVFYLIFTRQEDLGSGLLFLVGVLLGYSVVTEYPTLLVVGLLYLYALYTIARPITRSTFLSLSSLFYRRVFWLTLGAALVAMGWMVYNTFVFGGPLELGYSHSELWQDQHHTGFMSLNLPQWEAAWGITFSLFRGLFVLAPWLLLALPGFWLWWRSGRYRPELVGALAAVLVVFLFNSSSIMWWGGFAIGPRYLLPALPFMALSIIFVLSKWGAQTWFKILAVILFTWSLVATWGLTLAEQAFPPDTIFNPWLEYAWPNWQTGNIARNAGTLLGFSGAWSLAPLLVVFLLFAAAWLVNGRMNRHIPAGRPIVTAQPLPGKLTE